MHFQSISQDPKEESFVQNPYAAYQSWRKQPFLFWEDYGLIVSARYEVVNAIMRDRRFGREAPPGFQPSHPEHLKPFYDFEARSMLELEPPAHTRLRALVMRAFTSRHIASLKAEIKILCDQLIAQFPKGEFDLIKAYTEPIPVIVIARMIGVDEADKDQLLNWSHDMVAMYQAGRTRLVEEKAVKATLEFSEYIRHHADARRKNLKDDLISRLLMVEAEGDRLSMDELVTTVILLLNAGHEATVHAIANGIKIALEKNWRPSLHFATHGLEELLRIDPPLHMFTRYVREDLECFGANFAKGEQIGLLLGAANHDPEKYKEPEKFMPERSCADHLSFGAGLHFCIGAPLARLEMQIAIERLFAHCPHLKLTRSPRYADRYHFHNLEALWVKN